MTSYKQELSKFIQKKFYVIDPWGLYHKTLQIQNLQEIDKFCSKPASSLLSVIFTALGKHVNLIWNPYKLQIRNVFIVVAPRFHLVHNGAFNSNQPTWKTQKLINKSLSWANQTLNSNYFTMLTIEQRILKNVNNCLNTNIYSYLETCGG